MLGLRSCPLGRQDLLSLVPPPHHLSKINRILTDWEREMQPPGFPGLMTPHRAFSSVALILQLWLKFFWFRAKTVPPQGSLLPLPQGSPSPAPLLSQLPLPSSCPLAGAVPGAESSVLCLEFETQSIVPPLGSSEEEGKVLEQEEKYRGEEEKEEEEEEEEVEDEALWAWPSELSSLDLEAPLPTEPVPEESLTQASPPVRAALQPGASPPPYDEPEAPRPPRVLGPPTKTLPTPREGNLASPPPSTPVGAREIEEETGGPELFGAPRGESEETGSSEDAPSLLPATRAPGDTRDLETPSEENSRSNS